MSPTPLTNEQKWWLRFSRGALRCLLHPHQIPIYEAVWACINDPDPTHPSHYINCSRQLGKSFTETVVAVEFCIRFPRSTVLFVAPLRSQAEEILLGETYFRIFEHCPADLKPKLAGTTITFDNGSRIRMGGTDNQRFNDLRGGAAHLLILDECAFMQHLDTGVIPALQPMLSTTGGKTIYSSTPALSLEHPSTLIYRDHKEAGHISHFSIFDKTGLTDKELIKAYAETKSKQEADGTWTPSTRFRREYMAEHVMEGTILLAPDWDEAYCLEREPGRYHEWDHLYVSMDPGVTDFNAGLLAYYDHEAEHLHLIDEWTVNGQELNSDILSKEIKDKMALHWGDRRPYRYIADNNNKHLLNDLKVSYNLPFIPTSKTKLETTRAAYEEGMVTKVGTWLRRGRITVDPRCTMLLGNLRYGTWKEVGQNKREFSHSRVYGHFDHFAALVYLVRNVDERTNPVPAALGARPGASIVHSSLLGHGNKDLRSLARAIHPSK